MARWANQGLLCRFNTLAGGMEGGSGKASPQDVHWSQNHRVSCPSSASGNPFYQPDCILGDMDSINSASGRVSEAAEEVEDQTLSSGTSHSPPPSVTMETPTALEKTNQAAQPSSPPGPDRLADQRVPGSAHSTKGHAPSSQSPPALPSAPKVCRLKPSLSPSD